MNIKPTSQSHNVTGPRLSTKSPEVPAEAGGDKIDLGVSRDADEMKALSQALSRSYLAYKSTNSRREQCNIQRQMENLYDSHRYSMNDGLRRSEDKMRKIFQRTENAWDLKQGLEDRPVTSELEWNVRKFEAAQARPMTQSNLFNFSDVQTQRRLTAMKDLSKVTPGETSKGPGAVGDGFNPDDIYYESAPALGEKKKRDEDDCTFNPDDGYYGDRVASPKPKAGLAGCGFDPDPPYYDESVPLAGSPRPKSSKKTKGR